MNSFPIWVFIGGARTLISRTQKCLVPISDVATVPDVLRENVSAVDRWIQVSFFKLRAVFLEHLQLCIAPFSSPWNDHQNLLGWRWIAFCLVQVYFAFNQTCCKNLRKGQQLKTETIKWIADTEIPRWHNAGNKIVFSLWVLLFRRMASFPFVSRWPFPTVSL